jgi:hypothetical protein
VFGAGQLHHSRFPAEPNALNRAPVEVRAFVQTVTLRTRGVWLDLNAPRPSLAEALFLRPNIGKGAECWKLKR